MAFSTQFAMPVHAAQKLNVVAVHKTPQELAVKKRLEQVVKKYKLEKWLYTGNIRIDKDVKPSHSHPVLTLDARDTHLRDDVYLAGALLHEEFHWNMVMNGKFMPDESAAHIKAKFPGLDPRTPKGSGDEVGTYGHVLVCYMEYKALVSIFGEEAALKSLKALPFYTDIYALVTDKKNHPVIEELMRQDEVHI